MAPSHCSASTQSIHLTTRIADSKSRKDCILMPTISQTFADAMLFTTELDIDKIGVDSACM